MPTQFVRFAGCNLKCPGWPCDTPHAIDPKLYRKEQKLVPVRDATDHDIRNTNGLIGKIIDMRAETGASNVCLTGGEPMLQPIKELTDLAMSLVDNWHFTVEMFSNGTIHYPEPLLDVINFVVDWKLSDSGEDPLDTVRIKNIDNLYGCIHPDNHVIKFTCKTMKDLNEAFQLAQNYDLEQAPGLPSIFVGRVWDSPLTNAEIVDFVLQNKLNWKLNVQLHNMIWDPQERGR